MNRHCQDDTDSGGFGGGGGGRGGGGRGGGANAPPPLAAGTVFLRTDVMIFQYLLWPMQMILYLWLLTQGTYKNLLTKLLNGAVRMIYSSMLRR